jgi:hypothetical protein
MTSWRTLASADGVMCVKQSAVLHQPLPGVQTRGRVAVKPGETTWLWKPSPPRTVP